MKPICVPCQRFYSPLKNGFEFIESRPISTHAPLLEDETQMNDLLYSTLKLASDASASAYEAGHDEGYRLGFKEGIAAALFPSGKIDWSWEPQ
jgi:hypothetical protein